MNDGEGRVSQRFPTTENRCIWCRIMFTILIVEGSPAFRRSLKDIIGFRFPGVRIREAADAEEALPMVHANPPDLIFTDVSLPGENGFELTKEVKRRHPKVHVVVLSSHDLDEYREAADEHGADHFFAKGSSTWDEIAVLVEEMYAERMRGGQCSEAAGG